MMQRIKQITKQALSQMGNIIPVKTRLSSCTARDMLNDFSPKPAGICYTQNTLDLQYDLQIIVPCYNIEKWVEKCLQSVLKQRTKYKVLISIVNDGSTDGTADILQQALKKTSVENINGGVHIRT